MGRGEEEPERNGRKGQEISREEIIKVLRELKRDKAPGADVIKNKAW